MSRRFACTLLGAILGLPVGSFALQVAPQQPLPESTPRITISGRTHPELLPDALVWEHTFNILLSLGKQEPGDDFSEERVLALSRNTLYIPPADVRVVLVLARDTLRRVHELREPLDLEHEGSLSLAWTVEQRRDRIREISDAIVEGRDELVRLLPRQSFAAVKRWIAASVVPGTEFYLYK